MSSSYLEVDDKYYIALKMCDGWNLTVNSGKNKMLVIWKKNWRQSEKIVETYKWEGGLEERDEIGEDEVLKLRRKLNL